MYMYHNRDVYCYIDHIGTYQIFVVTRHLLDSGKISERKTIFWNLWSVGVFLQNRFVLKEYAVFMTALVELLFVLGD